MFQNPITIRQYPINERISSTDQCLLDFMFTNRHTYVRQLYRHAATETHRYTTFAHHLQPLGIYKTWQESVYSWLL